jgi:hypothetical protein
MERLFGAFAPRLDAIESRLDSIERRQSALEASPARNYMLIQGPVYRVVNQRDDDDGRFLVEP